MIKDQILTSPVFKIGHNPITKKTIKKTVPKFRLDGNLNSFTFKY